MRRLFGHAGETVTDELDSINIPLSATELFIEVQSGTVLVKWLVKSKEAVNISIRH